MGKGAGKGKGKGSGWFADDMKEICCSGGGVMFWGLMTLGTIIFIIVFLSMTIEAVDSTEVAIPYDTVQCVLKDEVVVEGMHWKSPFGQFIKWPAMYKRISMEQTCNSKDGIEITLSFSFQYMPATSALYALTFLYENADGYRDSMKSRAAASMRNTCAKFTAQEFQTLRASVQATMLDDVAESIAGPVVLDGVELEDVASMKIGTSSLDTSVFDLAINNIYRPSAYEAAVALKEDARNDIDLAEAERSQKLTQARTKLLEAQTEANRTLNAAYTSVRVIESFANSNATAIARQYAAWEQMYSAVKTTHGFTTDALLTYISNRLIQKLESVEINLASPAEASYKDLLSSDPNPTASPSSAPTSAPSVTVAPTDSQPPSAVPMPAPTAAPSAVPIPAPTASAR